MSAKAIEEIATAIKHWQQAKKTSPPCPVFTAAALASYDEAQRTISARQEQLKKVLDDERSD